MRIRVLAVILGLALAGAGCDALECEGLRVDARLRPLDERGRPVHPRLLAAGAVLGGHEQATDGTGLGVAILTGWLAGRAAAGGLA